ncbi:MAG: hypothetical protein Ta2E_12050 [Mycoplasmoidaceae bacterium]|nr:MAG: hypothetical protein Ta2E_12050 [Mycoplasmoidaceae bacterium]
MEGWTTWFEKYGRKNVVMKLNNTAHFFLRNEDTKNFINWQMEMEAKDREVVLKEKSEYFFNWGIVSERQIRGKFHSLISEA